MTSRVQVLVLGALAGLTFCGCKSHPLGPYVSPRVEGEVVAVDTQRPLSGVKVTRGKPAFDTLSGVPKGGQLLMIKPPAETGPDGHFVLPGERVLSVIRGAGWNEIRLTFEKAGYYRVVTNVPSIPATNTASGEPQLIVGTVALARVKR